MLADLDALLVLSLACFVAGVAVLVCGIGAVRDVMHGGDTAEPDADHDGAPDAHLEAGADRIATAQGPGAVTQPGSAAAPADGAWVRVLEDATPTPARRQRSTPADELEPVHAQEANILERVLSGIRSIPEVRTQDPDADPNALADAATEAAVVATGHAAGGADAAPPVPGGDDRRATPQLDAASTPAGGVPLLPLWVPPEVDGPATRTSNGRRGISRLAAAIDAQADEDADVVVDHPAREASIAVPTPTPATAEAPAPVVRALADASAALAPTDASADAPVAEDVAPVGAEATDSGIGQLAALIDLNESRRTRSGGRAQRVGFRRQAHDAVDDAPKRKLPAGAERALLSIVEVAPDPRNTLALQRDPTAQVTITEVDRATALAAAERDRAEEAAARRRHPTAHRRSA